MTKDNKSMITEIDGDVLHWFNMKLAYNGMWTLKQAKAYDKGLTKYE